MKHLSTSLLRINALLLLSAIALLWASTSAKAQPGTLDASFNPGIGANGAIDDMVLQPDGKTIIGGGFTTVNSIAHKGIARLNADGTLDATFAGTGVDAAVNALALQSDGKVLFGGWCHSYNGSSINNIARANTNGSIDASFVTGSGANNNVLVIVVQPDGKILIGGYFSTYGGTARIHIARLNANGSLDASFNPTTGPNSGGYVRSIAVQPDGKILIGGDFTTYNGTSRNRIARLNADGSLDAAFNPGTGASSGVLTCAIQTDGKIMIGGDFTTYNGTGRNRIARLNADGSLDAALNPGTGANSGVKTCTIQSDGKIIIGGAFATYNGTGRKSIARLNADGSLDATFNPGTGANSTVETCAIQSDGKIMISGDFTSYSGTGRNRVARVLAADVSITWTGTTSTDWNTAANWSTGSVPGTSDDITIPNVANDPVISTTQLINNVGLASGATLTIASGGALTLNGALANAGAVNIQSGGSFLQGASSSIAGAGTFNVTRAGSSVYDFWSSPITNASTSVLGGTVYQYNPANGTNAIGDDAQDPAWGTPGGTMEVGRGYAASGAGTRTFTGAVNNGNVPRTVQYFDYNVSGMPFNLLGNPYPSGILAADFINANSALVAGGVVYLWDENTSGPYTSSDYATRNLSTGSAGGAGNVPGPIIGSHQGFKIRASANGTVNFTNAMRTAGNSTMLFRQADESEGMQGLWISATSEAMRYNQTAVVFSPDGSEGLDWGYDAPKLNPTGPLRFYSLLDEEPLAIQTYGALGLSTRTVPLGLHTNTSGIVTIALDSIEGLQNRDIVLEDRYENRFHNLRQSNYAFRAVEGAHHNRLFLRIGEGEATGIAETEGGLVAYIANGFLHLRTSQATAGTIELMDMGGRQVLVEPQLNLGQEVMRLDVSNLAKGVYAVRISGQTLNYTTKVIH